MCNYKLLHAVLPQDEIHFNWHYIFQLTCEQANDEKIAMVEKEKIKPKPTSHEVYYIT